MSLSRYLTFGYGYLGASKTRWLQTKLEMVPTAVTDLRRRRRRQELHDPKVSHPQYKAGHRVPVVVSISWSD